MPSKKAVISFSPNRGVDTLSPYRKKRIDPQWNRQFSGARKSHAARIKRHLGARARARPLAQRMINCGYPYKRGYPFPFRCSSPFCPACSTAYERRRQGLAIGTFESTPKDHIHFVTILMDVRLSLFDLPLLRHRRGGRFPSTTDRKQLRGYSKTLLKQISQFRKQLRKALVRSKNDEIIVMGNFELELVEYGGGRRDKDQYIEESLARQGISPDGVPRYVWVPHFHLCITVRSGGRYLTREEIVARLCKEFPLSHQRRVDPLKAVQEKDVALMKCTGYAVLQKTKGYPAHQVQELAMFLHGATRRTTALTWATGSFKRARVNTSALPRVRTTRPGGKPVAGVGVLPNGRHQPGGKRPNNSYPKGPTPQRPPPAMPHSLGPMQPDHQGTRDIWWKPPHPDGKPPPER